MGLGAIPSSHPLCQGMLGMHGSYAANQSMVEADLMIAIGVRFDDRVTGKLSEFGKHAKIIHIDIDPAEIGKNIRVVVPIVRLVSLVLANLYLRFEELRVKSDGGLKNRQSLLAWLDRSH